MLSIFAFMVVVSMSKVEKIITEYSFQDGNRLIEMLKNDDLLEDDARNSLKSISISLIKDHPFGMGIGQERKSLQERKALSNAQDDAVGNYSHNFFLEIMLNYGIIIGVVISALLVYLIFINFFKNKNETTKNIWLMFFSFGFLPLMFSGSYTNWPWFWLFLGVSVNIFYENKLVRKN